MGGNHKGRGNALLSMLLGYLGKPAIKLRITAVKFIPVMPIAQR